MKHTLYIFSATILFFMAGCQKLDREITTDLSSTQLETVQSNVKSLLSAVYAEVGNGFESIDGAMMASATDEAEHADKTNAVQNFNNGSWNAISNPNNVWGDYFRGIRKANVFLGSTDSINFDR